MNYIEAFRKKFDKEPSEEEIATMMQSVALDDQANLTHRSMKYKPKGSPPTTCQVEKKK